MADPDRTDEYHFVEIDFGLGDRAYDPPRVRFICQAPPHSDCHMVCANPACVEECACSPSERLLSDMGECNINLYIEASDECGRGSTLLPVTTEWDGNGYTFNLGREVNEHGDTDHPRGGRRS